MVIQGNLLLSSQLLKLSEQDSTLLSGSCSTHIFPDWWHGVSELTKWKEYFLLTDIHYIWHLCSYRGRKRKVEFVTLTEISYGFLDTWMISIAEDTRSNSNSSSQIRKGLFSKRDPVAFSKNMGFCHSPVKFGSRSRTLPSCALSCMCRMHACWREDDKSRHMQCLTDIWDN